MATSEENITASFVVTKSQVKTINVVARELKVSHSWVVRRALDEGIKKLGWKNKRKGTKQ